MSWPQANEFQDAVLNPQLSFIDEELRAAEVVTAANGLPIPAAGQFGIVYQMRSPRGRWAVKCFTGDMPGRQERYRKISAHLHEADLPFTVGFEYLEQGIFINEQWYPILKMDWVEGQTLNQFVSERINNPSLLKLLTEMWTKLEQRLRDAQITHADLQHGNIMLIPAKVEGKVSLKLVDYDGMYLPSLAGTSSGELGHPTYQHPQRLASGYYGPEVDHFSHLVIYTALRAVLARGAGLWQNYDHGDNLLFKQADFKAPQQSKVLKELWQEGPDDVRSLAGRLALAAEQPIEQVPKLADVLDGSRVRPLTAEQIREVERILAVPARAAIADRAPAKSSGAASPAPAKTDKLAVAKAAAPKKKTRRAEAAEEEEEEERPFWQDHVKMGLLLGGIGLCMLFLAIVFTFATSRPQLAVDANDQARNPNPTPLVQKLPEKPLFREVRELQHPKVGVRGAAMSRDGKRVVAIGYDDTIRLWDADTGLELKKMSGRIGVVNSVAISADGRWIASASSDSTVILWDAATGYELQRRTEHKEAVQEVAISGDGRWIVSGGRDQTVRLWDTHITAPGRIMTGHTNWVTAVAISPDGKWIVSAGGFDPVRLWDAATGKERQQFKGHKELVYSVAISADGQSIVSGGSDRTVRLWDASTGLERHTMTDHTNFVDRVAISADGASIVSAGTDHTLRLWDAATGQQRGKMENAQRFVAVALSADGKRLASASADGTMKIWEISPASAAASKKTPKTITPPTDPKLPVVKDPLILREIKSFAHSATTSLRDVALSGDGKWLATAGDDKTVVLWDANAGTVRHRLVHAEIVFSVALSANGHRIVCGVGDKNVRIWNRDTGGQIQGFGDHKDAVMSVAVSDDGTRVVSAGDDATVRFWDAIWPKLLKKMQGHTSLVVKVALSGDGKWIVSGGYDKIVRLWNADTGQHLKTMIGHTNTIVSLAISADGKRIVSAASDNTVRLWNADTGEELKTVPPRTKAGFRVAMSADGKRIVSSGADKTIRLWDTVTGQELEKATGHTGAVIGLAMSHDGKRLATGCNDGTIKLWEIMPQSAVMSPDVPAEIPTTKGGPKTPPLEKQSSLVREINSIPLPNKSVRNVAMSGDGKWIVAAGTDKTVRLWDAASAKVPKMTFPLDTEFVPTNVALSGDGRWLVAVSRDNSVRLFDTAAGKEHKKFNTHEASAYAVAISADGKTIVAGGSDKSVRVWNAVTGEPLRVINGHTNYVSCVAISADGKTIISSSTLDKTILIGSMLSDNPPRRITLQKTGEARVVAISADGKRIVSAGLDNMVRLWNADTLEELKTMQGHTKGVLGVAISADGKRIVSCSQDATIRLWDATTGQELEIITAQMGMVYSVALSADGTRMVSAGADGTIRLWEIPKVSTNTDPYIPPTPPLFKNVGGDTTAPTIEGRWQMIGGSFGGQKISEQEATKLSLFFTFKDGKWSLSFLAGKEMELGSYKVDATKKPATIDVMFNEAVDAGKTQFGIFQIDTDKMPLAVGNHRPIDTDRLTLALGSVGKDRPRGFDPGAGTEITYMKRVK